MPPKKHAASVPVAVPAPKGLMYEVGLRSKDGGEVVLVRAESGDEAAAKASKPGFSVVSVVPA